MKIKYLCALLLAALIYSCDDSTTGIGTDLIPGGDKIPANTDSYEFTTKSLLADSVYARTSTAYLGRYTDEQFGEFTADFIAQFTCMDNFKFEEELTKVIGVNISLQYGSFFGDSLNAMRLQVDTLDKVIPEKELSTYFLSPPVYAVLEYRCSKRQSLIKYTQFALFLLANILQIDKIILLLFNQKF